MRISDWSSDVCSSDLRGDGDRVAGVHAHRVEVLDAAHDDAVVRGVANHLHLELLPAQHRLLDQHLVHRRELEAALDDLLELLDVVGDAAAAAAEGERRPDDGREPDLRLGLRSEEHTSELQSLMRISYAVFCLKKKNHKRETP